MSARLATAEWADPALVEEKYLYRDGTIWLGRSASEHPAPVGYADDRHVCLVSGSRGGKGTTSIVNNLILWPGSICVVDPKGENATITASRRGNGSPRCQGLGQTVQVLDPFNAAQIDDSLRGRFNPLDALDPDNDETIDEAGRIADAVVVIHETKDPFWDESARSMVKGLILHVLTAPKYEGRRALTTVRKLIMRGDTEAAETLRELGERDSDIPSPHLLLWADLVNNPAFGGLVAGIGDMFRNMLQQGPKEYESVLQVANRNTEFIDSPAMQRCLEASDFQLSELKTLPGGLSLYLCLPQRYMSTHYRWLRMMIALIVTEMEKVRGRPAAGCPLLMVLDEFAGLKRMEVIENAVAQIAGYGVKLFFVLQSLEQLKAVYKDNWETFLANSGLKVFFNLEDHFSREYVSKLIGETEVIREVRSSSDSVSESESVSRTTSRSTSRTVSETKGKNWSVSSGKSWGINRSKSKSWAASRGENWTPGGFWGKRMTGGSDGRTVTQSESDGKSRGWTEGESHGGSESASQSRTEGITETESKTYGTSKTWTAGTSETVHKRALVTPDEIGQLFARVDDRGRAAYPGLALIIVSGAPPLAVRRVNYYEDFQFAGLFDPPPDYPFLLPEELTVDGRSIGPVFLSLFKPLGLSVSEWRVEPGMMVTAGEPAASVVTEAGTAKATITVPHGGMISAVPGEKNAIPDAPLFSVMYYEDGAPMLDPFAELTEYFGNVRRRIEEMERDLKNSIRKARLGIGIATAALAFLVAILGSVIGAGLVVALGFVAYFITAVPKERELNDVRRNLQNFSQPASTLEVPQAVPQPPVLMPAPVGSAASLPPDNSGEAKPEPPASPKVPADIGVASTSEKVQKEASGQPVLTAAPVDNAVTLPTDKVQDGLSQPSLATVIPVEVGVGSATDQTQTTGPDHHEAQVQTAKSSSRFSTLVSATEERRQSRAGVFFLLLVGLAIISVIVIFIVNLPTMRDYTVGKVNVSHFAGIKPRESASNVAALYGLPTREDGNEKWYGHIYVHYLYDWVDSADVPRDERARVRSLVGDDAVVDLLGRTKSDVIALLGRPAKIVEGVDHTDRYAIWQFKVDDQPVYSPELHSPNTLEADFGPDGRCSEVAVNWK